MQTKCAGLLFVVQYGTQTHIYYICTLYNVVRTYRVYCIYSYTENDGSDEITTKTAAATALTIIEISPGIENTMCVCVRVSVFQNMLNTVKHGIANLVDVLASSSSFVVHGAFAVLCKAAFVTRFSSYENEWKTLNRVKIKTL